MLVFFSFLVLLCKVGIRIFVIVADGYTNLLERLALALYTHDNFYKLLNHYWDLIDLHTHDNFYKLLNHYWDLIDLYTHDNFYRVLNH